ncbi:unnamed protein product [Ixodes pacificus]
MLSPAKPDTHSIHRPWEPCRRRGQPRPVPELAAAPIRVRHSARLLAHTVEAARRGRIGGHAQQGGHRAAHWPRQQPFSRQTLHQVLLHLHGAPGSQGRHYQGLGAALGAVLPLRRPVEAGHVI